jgi:hypothetical protein
MNQTRFTEAATATRTFSFFLFESDGRTRKPYTVRRNGQSVRFSGGLTLFVNPQDVNKEQPARNTVMQTPHGHWVDSFGAGLPRWNVRGVTGWRARLWEEGESGPGSLLDGYLAFHALNDLIQTYFDENRARTIQAVTSGTPQPLLRLYFRDHADDDYWIVEPDGGPTKRRTKDRPLWIEYELRLTGLEDLRTKRPGEDDAIGGGLQGGDERVRRIAEALTDSLDDIELTGDQVVAAGQTDPSGEQAVNRMLYASMDSELVEADPLPAVSAYYTQADLARDTGTTLPNPSAAKSAIESAGSVPESLSGVKSLRQRLDGLLATGKTLISDVNRMIDRATSYVTTPFKVVTDYVKDIRGMMLGLGYALTLTKVTARFGLALRNLRTSLRNLLCAVQSILAFPYLFVKGMRDSLQAIFDLFRLSGCASTFPRVKAPSWGANLPLAVPRPF